jgi:phosphoglycolate phosphatase-like HAD superfamily hydrolase
MFDVDGTLLESSEFDSECYVAAVKQVLGLSISGDWSTYRHVSDSGVLDEVIERHGLEARAEEIHRDVKQAFLNQIRAYLHDNPAKPLAGAATFLELLRKLEGVAVSIATGGWLETAVMKLQSAGIDISDIPMASSNDHFLRTEIMKAAESRSGADTYLSKTYFGDGAWDKVASAELGYNFILVGNELEHDQRIDDFTAVDRAMGFIGI